MARPENIRNIRKPENVITSVAFENSLGILGSKPGSLPRPGASGSGIEAPERSGGAEALAGRRECFLVREARVASRILKRPVGREAEPKMEISTSEEPEQGEE